MNATGTWGLHWFRRDLRIAGNAALQQNWLKNQGRVLGFFCFDPDFLQRPDFSVNRFGFFLSTLIALRNELRQSGGDLLVLDHGPKSAFSFLFEKLKQSNVALPASVSWNRDYEPFARERDSWAQDFLTKYYGIETLIERDHLLFEPEEIVNQSHKNNLEKESNRYYSVYSPFARRWFEALHSEAGKKRIEVQKIALSKRSTSGAGGVSGAASAGNKKIFSMKWSDLLEAEFQKYDVLDETYHRVSREVTVSLPPAGHQAAIEVLQQFSSQIEDYKEKRDFPSLEFTSKLSPYLKNGQITSAQVFAFFDLENEEFKAKTGRAHFAKELVWREFYYHILWHRPDVEKQEFLPQYRNLVWENDAEKFQAWIDGRTGYPIVDAGMRELSSTGFMHNRLRMIVASFLTKDLLIDWKWGERYFMQKLIDGDLAPNNGGWQWAASTGCDPQPYFRIFNPELQSRKFDEDGIYISRYVPELAPLRGTSEIHAPSDSFAKKNYVVKRVDHGKQRLKALEMYQIINAQSRKL